MQLDAYFERIGYRGAARADLDTLRDIVLRHATSIPFENLDPFLGRPVSLAPEDLERKLVREGRGGYCFEHNLLLMRVLRTLGFEASGLAARVLWMRDEAELTLRSHMLLRVVVDGADWLADVGFGGMTPTGVLALQEGIEQATPHEPFRLRRRDGDWWLQGQVRGQWRTLYRFDLQPQHPLDYEMPNHYVSTHPASHFVHGLSAALPREDGRLALRDRELSFHPREGETRKRLLGDAAELRAVLEGEFGLRLPDTPQLEGRLQGVFAR
ncbi:arylamine N-acetyltransferase family protein [Vulcaniibacterium tengchongense]|uniref:N-hydroxyarylamine O-acetyltransferase n=1 Tax=Vulcaniibacterium tengchongense TaxID=1273429 RepID=A0A3N4W9I3_9GAMM|nr:arylamine N-acetyltransferase [Vulcaniibacterium tengchongense]RPE81914.1 N-hydroxyarylamine O-acetyltransferase [Vulcaniibacterium tengchongense]